MKVIPLTPDDDIISVCDRLDWSDEKRVLFVLPEEGNGHLPLLIVIFRFTLFCISAIIHSHEQATIHQNRL